MDKNPTSQAGIIRNTRATLLVHADLPSSSLASPRVRAGGCTDQWTKHCVNRGLRRSEMKWPLLEFGKKLEQEIPLPLTPKCPASLPFRPPPCDGGQETQGCPRQTGKAHAKEDGRKEKKALRVPCSRRIDPYGKEAVTSCGEPCCHRLPEISPASQRLVSCLECFWNNSGRKMALRQESSAIRSPKAVKKWEEVVLPLLCPSFRFFFFFF